MSFENKIKVLVIDDLDVVVMAVSRIINEQPDMVVYATASDPYEAVKIISKKKPDVILLDIQMPRMDGLTFLRKLMSQHPLPVIMFSSVAEKGSANAIKALQLGAVSILPKPKNIISNFEFHEELVNAVRSAYAVRDKVIKLVAGGRNILKKNAADQAANEKENSIRTPAGKVIAIGASTGGTQALHYIFDQLPNDVPGIVIVQHMPGNFTRWFAESLNRNSKVHVEEARPGMVLNKGEAIIANGFFHMQLKKISDKYVIITDDNPPVNRHRPSVDVLFNSVAECAGSNAAGILLTGMGDDGARGLLKMKQAGAETIAQDELSAVVFGMPRMAISLNAAKKVMNLNQIINFIKSYDTY
jgi:two-component system chemotaxis response regulator CheB